MGLGQDKGCSCYRIVTIIEDFNDFYYGDVDIVYQVRMRTRSNCSNVTFKRRFTSTLQAWHKIVLFSAHVQINLEKLITSS